MNRQASVIWNGTLREGAGTMRTESRALDDMQYSFRTRFAEGVGTNPDELIAASIGGCFSMALSNELGRSGFHPQQIETTATATLEDLAAGWTVTRIQLDVRATVPNVSQSDFHGSGALREGDMSHRASSQHQHQHECHPQLMMPPLTVGLGKLRLHATRGSCPERALEISELRYRRLFETAQDGILILDADTGKIIDANPFFLDLLDYPFESIIGLQLWEIGLFDDIDANKAAFAKLQTEEYIRYENHPLRGKDGKVVAVEFVSNVYFVGAEKVIQCNIRDIASVLRLKRRPEPGSRRSRSREKQRTT